MGVKRSYTDAERASVLAMLKANGGNVARTSRATDVPETTVRTWAADTDRQNATADIGAQKTVDLAAAINAELEAIFGGVGVKRADASYKDQMTAAGILIDKLQLLTGGATGRVDTRQVVVFEYDDGDDSAGDIGGADAG